MFNIIKMDFYKLFKSKYFYILNIALLLVILFMGFFMSISLNMDYDTATQEGGLHITLDNQEAIDTTDPDLTEEEYYELQDAIKESLNAEEFTQMLYSMKIPLILLVVFISIFVCSEMETGFIKNIIPYTNSRLSLVISKNLIVFFFILVQSFIVFFGSMLSAFLVSQSINIGELNNLLIYIGIQFLLQMAFSSLIILVSYLFKNKAITVSIGILLSVNIHQMFLGALEKIIKLPNIKLTELSIIDNMKHYNFAVDDYKRIIFVSLVSYVLYNMVSIIRTRRMEID